MHPKVHARLLDLKDAARSAAQSVRRSAPYYLGTRQGAPRREWTIIAVLVVGTAIVLTAILGHQLMDQITALFT